MPSSTPVPKKTVLLTVAATLAALAVLAGGIAAVVIGAGLYDVGATRQHLQPTYDVLELAMRQSVRLRSRDIVEPPLADERLQLRGAACYRDKCVQCHGAPGVAQGDIGKGMQPIPGPLVDARAHWRPRELYWVTRHGIKMSGMPAWQYRLHDEELWALVAFMQRLPDLNAADYAQWLQRAPASPACGRELGAQPPLVPGDADRGRAALFQYACNACHSIPGVVGPNAQVGPPLSDMGRRSLIAGRLANTPDNMALWLMQTQQLKPGTAMPQLGVAEQDARDIASYLATLR